MQCNSEKFQPGQIEILTENREGINATLSSTTLFGLTEVYNDDVIAMQI